MKQTSLFILLLWLHMAGTAQKSIRVIVKDARSSEPLPGTTISVEHKKYSTDSTGNLRLTIFKPVTITITHAGYKEAELLISDTLSFDFIISLIQNEKELGEVIVSSSRIESRIENLPTKVEVLGAEEVDEETGIKPGNIASLLGDVAGIQAQQTSAVNGNIEMRVQGLPGKYTQLLRDGMPLFGNFAGGFSIMQIPPLDLKQIEIIKGASSTLYGGGAIAGLINVISKKPKLHEFEKLVLLNYSSLHEANAHVYLSARKTKIGFSFLGGLTRQKAEDTDKDGFSDVAKSSAYFIHPVIYFYPNASNTLSIGYNGNIENRNGGDMEVLKGNSNGLHQFFIENRLQRHTADFQWENSINTTQKLTVKSIASFFHRTANSNTFDFKGNQLSWYSEASYLIKTKADDIVFGINLNGEQFQLKKPFINSFDFTHHTIGLFIQDDWRLHPKLTIESGMRTDIHNQYGTFLLPRLALLYKINDVFTARLGGGLGYKVPTVFESEIDERDYRLITPLQDINPERSAGVNFDVNYHTRLYGTELTINQSFYLTNISDPVIYKFNNNQISFSNAPQHLDTRGLETYIQLNLEPVELYLGYTLTDARKNYDPSQPHVELSARNKFASVVGFEISDHLMTGIEAALTGPQYLENGQQSPSYWFTAAVIRYNTTHLTLVLNCENVFDYRQNKLERIVYGPIDNPSFKQLWGPIDGRVINLSARIHF